MLITLYKQAMALHAMTDRNCRLAGARHFHYSLSQHTAIEDVSTLSPSPSFAIFNAMIDDPLPPVGAQHEIRRAFDVDIALVVAPASCDGIYTRGAKWPPASVMRPGETIAEK